MILNEMTVEELETRQAALAALGTEGETEELEARAEELEAIRAELTARETAAAQAEETRRQVAAGNDPIIWTSEEVRTTMDVTTREYRELWIKNLQRRLTDEEQRAYTSASTNAVPTIVSEKLFEKMKKLAPMLSEITLLRVAGNVKFVAEGTRNTATAKHTENSAVAPAADTTVSVTLGGYEFIKVLQISRTAALMSIDAFEGWLIDMLAADIARSIDNYILNDASNGIAALTYTANVNQIVDTAGYTYGDVCDLIALLPAAYDAEAKFVTSKQTLYGTIAQITDSQGHPIFVPDTVNGVGGRLMGYPVLVDDYVTTANKALYLGRWADVVGNLSEDIHVDVDESAGFTSNSLMYRGVAVFDSKPAKGDGIVRLVSTTT